MSTLLDYLGVSRPQKKISWSLSSICHHFLLYNFIFLFPAVRLEVKIEGRYWIFGREVNLIMEKSISWFRGWCWVDDMVAYLPTLPDYPGISWIQSQSPALLYEWPKLPDKRKLTLVAHKKTKIKAPYVPKHPKWSGFLCLYYGLWLHFLAWCTLVCCKQKGKSFFFVTPI